VALVDGEVRLEARCAQGADGRKDAPGKVQ